MPIGGRQQDRARHRRAGRHGQHARERDDGADGGAVVPAAVGGAEADRLLGDGLPVDDLSLSRAAGRGVRAARRAGRGRSHRQHRSHARRRSTSRRRSSPSRTCCSAPRTSWTRRRSSGARAEVGATTILDTYQSAGIIPVDVECARRRLRRRRLPEVAVRRSGQRVSLHAARSAEDARSRRSPAGCRASIRSTSTSRGQISIFSSDRSRTRKSRSTRPPRRRDAHDERHAVDPGVLRGARGARHHQRGRRRSHPRGVARDDGAAARARRRVRLHVRGVARSGSAGRHRRGERAGRAARRRAPSRRATSSSTTGRRSASASRRTSTTRWTRSIG